MRLGINLGYWGAGMDSDNLAVAQEADRLGYAVCWAAEAYGSDAATVLSWVAAQTEQIDIGSAIFQIPARMPAMTAMTAATLDSLSGGRFRLGLGVSGPQVSEGWYGVKFDKPLARTREYVDIVRKAMSRERLSYQGEHWTLPLPGGPGKPLKLTVHPQREHIPLYIAAIGPKNLQQTGEIADGALLIFPSADHLEETAISHLRAGREKAGKTLEGFDVCPTLPLAVGADKDVSALADMFRPYTALYVGGMGSPKQNFYNQLAQRMGYEKEAAEIQGKYLSGDKEGAAAAIPEQLIDQTTLLGSVERIAERMQAYAAAGVTTLTLAPAGFTLEDRLASLRAGTEALERAGLA
ncbi:probable F420-dependent oxidoreductase, Rv3520c family [Streptomyces sp. 2224.1]|uniref:LLM class F420-dependent oxidoreductase n=1 Tax=unclassified Streptomyces TaxID=2593676 RepID=UPI0008862F07|nr:MULTISPECIES: LLM class F420-dependent oxidoreductase [unclassified Streptomyces]PBC81497.1 F420-dependent oxidoreductase-like protein [Streptomyces sp. 2321.6]SDR54697.1 probable F420-dependent oxidoreductase, Rv3520c family [Streptomyces sp. KS_16]SEC17733.1 probable F420-dependent oxidoreductase, Rv3520c family [Streptomyces sp. 2133.1]SED14070.1 probable F420-dependent oxidoreductase, Rv3520c family [Streptomyces sp. 2224.1]SEF07406.1 probable F420-dependent oxidoreductase, Rv3520c fami